MPQKVGRKRPDNYILSPFVVLEDDSDSRGNYVIQNSLTGERLRVTAPILQILKHFTKGATLASAIAAFGLVGDSRERLLEILNALLESSMIVVKSSNKSDIAAPAGYSSPSIPTIPFVHCPTRRVEDVFHKDVVILGVPIDSATTGCPGARLGPDALRTASARFAVYERDLFSGRSRGWYSADLGRTILKDQIIIDIGDLCVRPDDSLQDVFARLTSLLAQLFTRGARPVTIGGDHSISAPIIRAASEHYNDLTVIHVDAHTDLAPWTPGRSHHHGNVIRRILDDSRIREIYHFGARGFSGDPFVDERYHFLPQSSVDKILLSGKIAGSVPCSKVCYLTLDIDAIDPCYAPGVGTPIPFGFEPRAIRMLLRAIAEQNDIIGLDVVELCPPKDRDGATADLVFHLLIDLMASAWDK